MNEIIARLDDSTAQRILSSVARARLRSGAQELAWSAELRQALGGSFDLSVQPQAASAGDLARQALLLLAEDPDTRDAIVAMAENLPETRQ